MANNLENIKWGIIGVGDVCEKKSGPAFSKVQDSSLTGVMRRDSHKVKDYALRHQVGFYTTQADELLQHPEINAIYIATPPAFHEEYTLKALEAGKAVYIEKPVTLNSNSLNRMMDAERNYNGRVSVAHYRRGLAIFKKIKQLIEEEAIGKILFVDLQIFQTPQNDLVAETDRNWRIVPELSGGGIFHDLSPHQLDLIYWYFGKPKKMRGFSTNIGKNYNAPDYTRLDIQFENGVLLNGTWSFAVHQSADREKCEIIGEKGKIEFSFFRSPVLKLYNERDLQTFEFPFPQHIQQPHIENVVKYFKGQGPNPCSLNDAMGSMKMIDVASQSL